MLRWNFLKFQNLFWTSHREIHDKSNLKTKKCNRKKSEREQTGVPFSKSQKSRWILLSPGTKVPHHLQENPGWPFLATISKNHIWFHTGYTNSSLHNLAMITKICLGTFFCYSSNWGFGMHAWVNSMIWVIYLNKVTSMVPVWHPRNDT